MKNNYRNTTGASGTFQPDSHEHYQPDAQLIPGCKAANLCGVSESSWWAHNAAKLCPAPIRIGGSTRWRLSDIIRWIDAGCPNREKFEAMRRGSR